MTSVILRTRRPAGLGASRSLDRAGRNLAFRTIICRVKCTVTVTWSVPDLTSARFYPDFASTKKCPLVLLGPKRPALLVDGEEKPFDPTKFSACIAAAPGYSMGFDAAVRAQSLADAVLFLQRSLRP